MTALSGANQSSARTETIARLWTRVTPDGPHIGTKRGAAFR